MHTSKSRVLIVFIYSLNYFLANDSNVSSWNGFRNWYLVAQNGGSWKDISEA